MELLRIRKLAENTKTYLRMIFILGLAAGTILYIVVFEVLLREKSKRVPGLLQFLFIVLGFTAMLLVNIYGKYEYFLTFNMNSKIE